MSLTPEQLANRKLGIGASECAIVMGINEHMSPYELWQIKTGRLEPKDISQLPPVYWGTKLEDIIADEYAITSGHKVRRVTSTLFHEKYKHILCHIDRKVEGVAKVLECKFAMYARDQWGPSGSDEVPMSYILQVQHQMLVTGYEQADLAVLISGYDFRVYHFKRDEGLISKITEELNEFWACVESDTPPQMRDRRDVQLAYPFSVPNAKPADCDIVDIVGQINEIRNQAKQLETKRTTLENNLTLFMKEAEAVITETAVLATWKSNKNGTRVLRINERAV